MVEATTLSLIIIFSGLSLIPILLVQGFVAGAMMPLLLNSMMDLPEVGPKAMGTAAGLYFTVGEAGGVGGPALVGILRDATGSFTPELVLLVFVALLSMVPAYFLGEKRIRAKSAPATASSNR